LRAAQPEIIVLDHGLSGQLTGLDAAPRLKKLAPQAKIIMFTSHADLKARADQEPAIDGFVLKTESPRLLPLAQRLTGLGAPPI
jgi:DNA-binding NarL/FixJ family response regulator